MSVTSLRCYDMVNNSGKGRQDRSKCACASFLSSKNPNSHKENLYVLNSINPHLTNNLRAFTSQTARFPAFMRVYYPTSSALRVPRLPH